MSRPVVLYLSLEGLLEPLGQSQVLAYVRRLNALGFPHHVVSLERPSDLSDVRRLDQLRRQLDAAGIRWTWFPYEQGSPRAVANNTRRLLSSALAVIRTENVGVLHARAFVPATVAWTASGLTGVPYVFDTRADWIAERVGEGQFRSPWARRAARAVERRLFRDAAAVVTLTELYAQALREEKLIDPATPAVTIPTCADYDRFASGEPRDAVPGEVRARLAGKRVVGFVGSLNRSYCVDESLALFRRVLDLRRDSHLLVLTRQRDAFDARRAAAGIPPESVTVATAHHEEMPAWLGLMDWGFLLLAESGSKRGSMPTKLAEFFASGVRPIHFGCNDELGRWIRRASFGLTLSGLSASQLDAAAETIAADAPDDSTTQNLARQVTRSHFGLEAGVDRYAAVFEGTFREDRNDAGVRGRIRSLLRARPTRPL